MPKSSRHKSHKQSKHSNKEYYSGSEEDSRVKDRNFSKEESSAVRVSKDLSSGEKRKLGHEVKDLANGNAGEEHVASKRRKDRGDAAGSDRWIGGGEFVVDVDGTSHEIKKGESSKLDSDKGSKSKGVNDVKSKSSRRNDGDKREESGGVEIEKEESKSVKVESKQKEKVEKEKTDKDSRRKEVHQYKDLKEKDRERDRRGLEKRTSETQAVEGEGKRKQGIDVREEEKTKRGMENNGKKNSLYLYFFVQIA